MKGERTSKLILGTLVLLAVLLNSAGAATVQYDATPIPPTKTDWVGLLISLPQFNPALGTLTAVEVTFESAVVGEVGVENLADVTSDVDLSLSAVTEFRRGATLVLTLNPSHAETKSLPAHDGNLDWGGTSGAIYAGFTGTDSDTYVPAVLADWIGVSTVDFTVSATATSQTNGTGNIASYYKTNADAKAAVKYTYIPEPASLLAFSAGLIGTFGAAARRRRQQGR
jgi:hypothetical protein